MNWQQSSLKWPNTASEIQTSAEQVTDQIGTTMNDAVSRLTSLESDANYGRHSLSSEAQSLLGLRSDLQAMLNFGTVLSVTPYQFEVGNKLASGSYLNPREATAVLVKKMRDHSDHHRPIGERHCIAIMLTANQLSTFANMLADIVSVFPLPEWSQVAMQAKALVTNEVDKFHQPAAIIQPRFKPAASLNVSPLGDYLAFQGSQLATLESLADDKTNIIEKLQGLANKRADKLNQLQQKITQLKSLQGLVWAMSMTGNAESIATKLAQSTAPNNHQFTIATVMLSQTPMPFLNELLC